MKDMEIKTYQDLAKVDDPMLRRLKSERENLLNYWIVLKKDSLTMKNCFRARKNCQNCLRIPHLKRDLMVSGSNKSAFNSAI